MELKRVTKIVILSSFISLIGCSATTTAIKHRELDVRTTMANSMFLNPVSNDKKNIYIKVTNTSDKPDISLDKLLADKLSKKGYTIVEDMAKASYLVQANILQVGKMDPSAAEGALNSGYGGALVGGALGYSGSRDGRKAGGMLGGAILGGLAESAVNAVVENVTFTTILDLKISERGKAIINSTQAVVQGTGGVESVTYNENSEWRPYTTRVLSTANKVNLDFEEALPAIENNLTNSIAGLF